MTDLFCRLVESVLWARIFRQGQVLCAGDHSNLWIEGSKCPQCGAAV